MILVEFFESIGRVAEKMQGLPSTPFDPDPSDMEVLIELNNEDIDAYIKGSHT
jgi:hypothetical protein